MRRNLNIESEILAKEYLKLIDSEQFSSYIHPENNPLINELWEKWCTENPQFKPEALDVMPATQKNHDFNIIDDKQIQVLKRIMNSIKTQTTPEK